MTKFNIFFIKHKVSIMNHDIMEYNRIGSVQ